MTFGREQNFDLTPTANWTSAARTFLWDPVNGNDANPGFSDAAGPYTPATQARRTLAGMRAIFPRHMGGKAFRLIIASQAFATPDLNTLLAGTNGIGLNSLIRGTSTNATANATAWQDDAAERIFAGYQTATNGFAAGYNPTGAVSTTSVQLTKVGGGGPAFPAEPASPLGFRLRFDANTATVALRNICRQIVSVTGGDTLGVNPSVPLPAVPAAGDVCYVEMPGLTWAGTFSLGLGRGAANNTPQFVGQTFSGSFSNGPGGVVLSGCSFGGTLNTTGDGYTAQTNNYTDPFGGAIVNGGGVRCETTSSAFWTGAGVVGTNGSVFGGLVSLANNSNSFNMGGPTVYGAGLVFQGAGSSFFAGTIGAAATKPRIIGAGTQAGGLVMRGTSLYVAALDVTGMGAKPAILCQTSCVLQLSNNVTGSTGNTDVGLDVSQSTGCLILLPSVPTVTGAAGDVRVAVGGGAAIITWAQAAAGFCDSKGNRFLAPNAVALPMGIAGKFSGVLKNSGGAAASTFAADDSNRQSVNQATAQQYPTSTRLMLRLRLVAPSGTPADSSLTATLYQGGVATAMTCTIAANLAAGSSAVDTAHPIVFFDGNTFDVQINGTSASDIPFTATLEYAAG